MKTLVLGASPNPDRVSNQAVHRLLRAGYEAVPVGIRKGEIAGLPILLGQPAVPDVHTITLYLNAHRQEPLYDYILDLQPRRIIFNPGTENPVLAKLAHERGIEVEVACTLVMLSLGMY
jgi:predicted CoA-binding protein